jgi:hypothetical protein
LSANGPVSLTVPVFLGSFHKTRLKDTKIDYSKRWQQIHLRTLESAYKASPFYEYYADPVSAVILSDHKYLIDLDMHSLHTVLKITGISREICFTQKFVPAGSEKNDFRYIISPKKEVPEDIFSLERYPQVFEDRMGFVKCLSILDLLFNTGPECVTLLGDYIKEKRS